MTSLVILTYLATAALGIAVLILPRGWLATVPILKKSFKARVIVRLFGLWLLTEPIADIISANPELFSGDWVSKVQPTAHLMRSTALLAVSANLLFGSIRLLVTGVLRLEGLRWRPLPFMSSRPVKMNQNPEGYRIKERLAGLAVTLMAILPTAASARWFIDAALRLWSGT